MPAINSGPRIPDYSDPGWLAGLARVGESWPGTGGTSTAGGGGGTPPFNLNAPSRTGQGPFGNVPGAIGVPGVYNDVAGAFPNLSGNVGALSAGIGHELAGELDPQTIAQLQNTSAQFGIGAGVPLSPFSGAQGLRHLGTTVEAQRSKGISDLLSALPTVAKSLTVSPETQLDVANRNATFNAAPDPAAANAAAQALFNAYLKKTAAGGGQSFGGGGGSAAPRNQNAPGFADLPWAPASGVGGGFGTLPASPAGGSRSTPWSTQGPAPQDLWSNFAGGFQGPQGGGPGATPGGGGFNDWFSDPSIGGGGGGLGSGGNFQAGYQPPGWDWGEGSNPNPVYPDFPEWS